MKRLFITLILILSAICSVSATNVCSNNMVVSDNKTILILNSYQEDVVWSKNLSDNIADQLKNIYPNIKISVQYLNSDIIANKGTILLRLRSILWSMSDNNRSLNVESLHSNTIFPDAFTPDVFIIIGEEAFLTILNQRLNLNKWIHVPMVLCAVDNMIARQTWAPELSIDMNDMVPIENKRVVNFLIDQSNLNETIIDKIDTTKKILSKDGSLKIPWKSQLNFTGVKMSLNIKKNLDLIFNLHPTLKEIVWVDNNYYKASYTFDIVQKLLSYRNSNVKLSRMTHNRLNTDSIYNEMLRDVPDRVYLSHSWHINAMYSHRFQGQMDSLFTSQSKVPLYSLSQTKLDNNYFIGGYYADYQECTNKTINIVKRILNGERANDIPFDSVSKSNYILNQTALQKYGLYDNSCQLDNVIYTNVPATFYKKHENSILIFIILFAIAVGIHIVYMRHKRFCRVMEIETERFRRLYDKIQTIYGHALIDFAFYDKHGKCIMWVVNGKKNLPSGRTVSILNGNLFLNTNFTFDQLNSLRQSAHMISNQVQVSGNSYRLMAKCVKLKEYENLSYMAIVADISKVIAEKGERELYEQMFECVSDFSKIGIASYNINKGSCSATEYWYTNLSQKNNISIPPTYDNVYESDRETLLCFWDKALKNNTTDRLSQDIRILAEDGSTHWVRQNIFVNLKSDNQIIEINLNIDYRKKRETELMIAKRKEEDSEREIIGFLENISHEIRTPLNSIIGFSSIIAAGESEDDQMFENIIRAHKKMLNDLLDNIVNLSKIDSKNITLECRDIDVNVLFDNLYDTTLSYIYEKQITVSVIQAPQGTIIHSDEHYLNLVLINLLSNAVKFTEYGDITIEYNKGNIDGEHYIYVSDTGIGIAAEDHEKIFNRFEKLDKYTQGTGLGLSLCKSILNHMGGEIGVISELEKGSKFWIRLTNLK